MIASSGNVARLRRQRNRPIQNDPLTQKFAASSHPKLSPAEQSASRSESAQDKRKMREKGLGPIVRRIKQDKQAAAEAAANPNKKKEERFGMSKEEYNRRFAKD
jgi:hypothetical protein